MTEICRVSGVDPSETHDPDLGQLPLDGRLGVRRVVVGDGDGGQVGEDGEEDCEVRSPTLIADAPIRLDRIVSSRMMIDSMR